MTCWNRILFIYFFLQCPSPPARKRSHGTSSPHLVPAHAVRIMDGDQNTYKAKFTAAPQTEPGLCICCFSSDTECQNNKIKKTHSKLPWSILNPNGFYSCQTYCLGSSDGSRATSINTNDDERVELMKFHDDLIEMWKQERSLCTACLWDLRGSGDYKWICSTYCLMSFEKQYGEKVVTCPICEWSENDSRSNSSPVCLTVMQCAYSQAQEGCEGKIHTHKQGLSRLISVVSV